MSINEESLCSIDDATCKSIIDNATFDWPYFFMNILATIIASYGLLANSAAIVIGAMIIAMLLGPIVGIGLSLADNDIILLKKSLSTLTKGVIGVIVTAFIIGLIHKNVSLTDEIIARTSPNIFDLMVGLAGGAAAAYTTISPRLSVSLVGVAIATALVPPLASASILLSRGEVTLATGAFLLFFTNMTTIQFSASTVLWINGIQKTHNIERFGLKKFFRRNIVSVVILVLLAIILSSIGHRLRTLTGSNDIVC